MDKNCSETHNEHDIHVHFHHNESMESGDQISLVEDRPTSSSTSTSSSSSLLSLHSAVTEPSSQKHINRLRKESPSLCNYLKSAFTSSAESTYSSQEESESDISEPKDVEDACVWRDSILHQDSFPFKSHPLIDPIGWIKCASNQDPWNKDNYFSVGISSTCNGVLTRELISECSSRLDKLPDTKAFVLTRLHIERKGLEDISVLEHYRYFQYIDVSWNCLISLAALSNCTYLIYLNASHNKLTTVLDVKPPWFLTHVNLESNKIKEIGQNLSNFWSLSHLNLSSNFIEKIEGLGHLKYLRYLNLSHNKIKRIENLDCIHLEEFNLEFNEISECDMEEGGLQALENIKILNLAHNQLSTLTPFQDLFSLKKLNISCNCVAELYEINNLKSVAKCYELNNTGNPVCSNTGYREFVIYLLPSLRVLDTVPIKCSERVAAKMLLEPDIFTSAQHLRTKLELWNQLALREINTETMPSDEPPVPLVVLVGTFMNGREEIAKALALKFPNQVYRCKKYTTLPLEKIYNTDHLKSVPIDEFNNMIKTGKLIFHYKEIGYFFGMCQEEISTCIVEGKIGVVDTILEAALVMKYSELRPFLILSVTDDVESYGEKLKNRFMDLDLWPKHYPSILKNLSSERRAKQRSGESKPNNLKAKLSHESIIKTPRHSSSDADINPTMKCIKRDNNNIHPSDVSFTLGPRGSGSVCSECRLKEGPKRRFETNCDTQKSKTSKPLANNSKIHTCNCSGPNTAECMMADCNQHASPEKHRSLDLSKSGEGGDGGDSFVWTWSIESSVGTIESEPDPAYLDLVRGTEMFVQKTLHQQETYVEMHNLRPGLFFDTVLTDDIDKAVKKLGEICFDILKNRTNQRAIKDLLEESTCADFVQQRLNYLLNDLINISF